MFLQWIDAFSHSYTNGCNVLAKQNQQYTQSYIIALSINIKYVFTSLFLCVYNSDILHYNCRALNTVEYYNPDTDVWELTAPVTNEKIGVAAVGYNSQLYVVGGFMDTPNQKLVLDGVECYDPTTNRWATNFSLRQNLSHVYVWLLEMLIHFEYAYSYRKRNTMSYIGLFEILVLNSYDLKWIFFLQNMKNLPYIIIQIQTLHYNTDLRWKMISTEDEVYTRRII